MKKLAVMMSVVMCTALCEAVLTCKLKASCRVDVLDEKGAVIETRSLKGGAVVTYDEDQAVDEGAKSGKKDLKPTGMTIAEFKMTRPSKGAVFRVRISLKTHPYYDGIFVGKENSIMQYNVAVLDNNGSCVTTLDGYCQKNSPIGKKLRQRVTDSEDVLAYAWLTPIKQMGEDDVIIKDLKFL